MSPPIPSRRLGDLAYALGGWFLLALAPATGALELLAPHAVASGTAFPLAGLAAVPLAALHWLERWSVGPLGAMFFWTMALAITAGLPLAFLLDWFAVGGGLGEPAVRLGFLAVVYAGAYVVGVRRRADDPRPRA
ncbi:hypothetical protein HUG10_16820 [Halorarum halophilum]|uniref:Uncharacterized protein n=1 Tax=Halorarum halophilum TaxID=2743090 RepID=A0A7D5GYY3_9EURY|nr:hypothetical protein [Halobaculum halophilum]QLG29089.1 hypothetical protein HUG10_16820 [Halobaculum halophilum]